VSRFSDVRETVVPAIMDPGDELPAMGSLALESLLRSSDHLRGLIPELFGKFSDVVLSGRAARVDLKECITFQRYCA
jgi:hypothetical protein